MCISSGFFSLILIVFVSFLKRGEIGVKLGRWGRIWKKLGEGKLVRIYCIIEVGGTRRGEKKLVPVADCPVSWQ